MGPPQTTLFSRWRTIMMFQRLRNSLLIYLKSQMRSEEALTKQKRTTMTLTVKRLKILISFMLFLRKKSEEQFAQEDAAGVAKLVYHQGAGTAYNIHQYDF